jgi:hypothetical protein
VIHLYLCSSLIENPHGIICNNHRPSVRADERRPYLFPKTIRLWIPEIFWLHPPA